MTPRQATRATDPNGVHIDRKIPLWGVLSVVGCLLGQAVVVWDGQRLQAAEIHHQSEQIADLTQQVKAMATQLATKETLDVEQNLRITGLERRVNTLETTREAHR